MAGVHHIKSASSLKTKGGTDCTISGSPDAENGTSSARRSSLPFGTSAGTNIDETNSIPFGASSGTCNAETTDSLPFGASSGTSNAGKDSPPFGASSPGD